MTLPATFNAAQLMAASFPPPRWAVRGILPEGLTVLAGAPKAGKSWLSLGIATAVASGGTALGGVPVQQGPVLALLLEDTPRRLQTRIGMLLGERSAPADLSMRVGAPRMPVLGDKLDEWLEDEPNTRLVVVDVLERVRPERNGGSAYGDDYAALTGLKAVADRHGVAVLVIHHTRKQAADDFLDLVSGTQGVAGAADTIAVLKRARNAADGLLSITGRDVGEYEHALRFDAERGCWSLTDRPPGDFDLSESRRRVLDVLRETEGLTPAAIAERLGLEPATARQTVTRMAKAGQLDTDGEGHYFAPHPTLSHLSLVSPDVTGVTGVTGVRGGHPLTGRTNQ